MPDKETPEEEELLKDITMIRKSGNVHVATIPSALMKNRIVQNNKGKQGPIRLVRKGRQVFLQIPLQVSFDGRILEVKREKE